MSQVPGKARDRKFNFYVEQHLNKYANQLNRTIVRLSDFVLLRTDISAESVHEALIILDTNVFDIMRELWEFQNMTKSEFELVFEGWQINFIKIMNDVARPGLSIGYDE